MSISFTQEITFETATFDIDSIITKAKDLSIPVMTERLICREYTNLPVDCELETDFTTIKFGYDSYRAKAVSELVKLIPKPYQVTSGDDLEGEWKETTTVVE